LETDPPASALVLSPEAAYPLTGGGALRTASLLEYLARRYALDLIVFRQPGAPDPAASLPPGMVRRLTVLDLPANRRDIAARAWRNAARVTREVPPLVDRFAGFDRQVAQAVENRTYEIGLIEHFWCAPYLDVISAACHRTVVDLHNVESVLHARCAAVEGTAAGFAHRVFCQASLRLERAWLPRFSEVLATSAADAATVRAIAPTARVRVYPNAIPWTPVPDPPPRREQVLVFSGNMEYHPNLSAVRFFRAEVWPRLRAEWPDLVWRLVGKNPEAVRPLVSGDARIEIRGPVDDAIHELARASIAVVPLSAGSGTRFKILEAWAAGLPVVSTTLGAEGLPVRHEQNALLADSGAAFAQAVSRLLACEELRQRLAAAGRLLLEKEFTWEKAWQNLDF
jgi:glycosyltransferase involved in cell wall biosynthesis